MPRPSAAWRAIVADVRARRRRGAAPLRAAVRSARRPDRGHRATRCARRPRRCRRPVRAAIRDRRPQHPHGRTAAGAARLARAGGARASPSSSAIIPLDRVGCYVPGGRYPLPSSLLMTAIPAAAAGVREIVVVCPRPEPVVMAAALEAGVSRLFRIGGAHAIAALAYGTAHRSARRQDRRARQPLRRRGQGARRRRLRHRLLRRARPRSSSSPRAGPAAWIAADLIAQAEHDPDARAVLITPSRTLAARVARDVEAQLPADGPAARVAARPRRHHRHDVGRRGDGARQRRGARAPGRGRRAAGARWCACAGSLFVGPWSAQVAGDYAIGSNHVLPTAGAARVRGGLSAADFVRQITVQRVTRAGLRRIGGTVMTLADGGRAAGARGIDRGRISDLTARASGVDRVDESHIRDIRIRATGCGCTSTRTPAAARRACSRRSATCGRPTSRRIRSTARPCRRRARHFGVDPDWVLLTNGLDEGILMAAVGHIARPRMHDAETIIPLPAFDPYPNSTAAVGATAVRVPPGPRLRVSDRRRCSTRSRRARG